MTIHGWLVAVVIVLVVVAVLAAALALLALRRRWLAREGGTFECSIRLRPVSGGSGWVLGVARYHGDEFEWFRFFSYSARPRKTFERDHVTVLESRAPEPAEAVALYSGQQVVLIAEEVGSRRGEWALAMSRDSLTGLLSWLEASPPRSQA